jgi:hypothetical protein
MPLTTNLFNMKKFTSLLIGCSLALAGITFAQQPDEQQSPTKNKKAPVEKTQREPKANVERPHKGAANANGANGASGANAANPEATTAKPQRGMHNERNAGRGNKPEATTPKTEASVSKESNASAEAGAGATATVAPNKQAHQGRKGAKGEAGAANAKTAATASPMTTPVAAASPSATPATSAPVNAGASVNTQQNTNVQTNVNAAGGAGRKADPQKVQQVKQQTQQIKQQHVNFRAQARPDRVPAVSFQANYRIQGSDRWQGPQYEVFRSYHPERHDHNWYHSRYSRVELIGGGYYYFNSGYWYPAWGYSPSEEYYAYDAPIYVGHRAEPPDRVIADVQSELQEMGYYTGEVDGLLGPITRQALTDYQADQGLNATAVIDEPTLDSLGMS